MVKIEINNSPVQVLIGVDEIGEKKRCIVTYANVKSQDSIGFSVNNDILGGEVNGVRFRIHYNDETGIMEVKQMQDRLHLWHLKVSDGFRGMGIGTFLIDIFKEFVRACMPKRISGRIGNGGSKEFLEKNGFPEEHLEEVGVTAGYKTTFDAVAIGRGSAKADVETARALETYEGFPARKLEGNLM